MKADQTPAEIVRIPCAALSAVNTGTGGTVYSEAVITSLLLDMTAYFGVTWTMAQMTECAALWASEYYWMSIAEIKHFLAKCKTGEYSKTDYRHLTPFLLMGWLEGYTDQLLKERRMLFDEREAVRRRDARIALDNDPNANAFNIDAVIGKLSEVFTDLPTKTAEAQAAEDAEFQRRRDEHVRQYESMVMVPEIVERIAAGQQITSPEDLQFYENHKEAIENELKRIHK